MAPEDDEDDEERPVAGRLLAVAAPLLLLALWGASFAVSNDRLGNDESAGLLVPSLIAGAVAAGVVGATVAHWIGDGLGRRSFVASALAIAGLALGPSALAAFGFMMWTNGLGLARVEHDVDCTIVGKEHRPEEVVWRLSYTCEVDGARLRGTVLTPREPHGKIGDPVRFVGARGRLGIWVRRSDELPIASR